MHDLVKAVLAFRDERDWRQFHNPKDLAISVSLEAAELLESFQWKTPAEAAVFLDSAENRRRVADEMADVLILLSPFGRVKALAFRRQLQQGLW